jgi:hypothetical protein
VEIRFWGSYDDIGEGDIDDFGGIIDWNKVLGICAARTCVV